MRNIVGIPAKGEDFYHRQNEIDKISSRLRAGNNLQIAAPRRVGKTSILHFLKDNQVDGHIYVYVDTERVDNEQDFYKKLLKAIVKIELITSSQKLAYLLKEKLKFFKGIKSIKVMGHGIDFSEDDQVPDFYEEITNFLSGFELEEDKKLIFLIDEFPQTILNIIDRNSGNTKEAIQFLQSNRELRLNADILGKIQFVYTGSIGLNHTVASINASAFVNDLNSTDVAPLTPEEAAELVNILLQDKGITIADNCLVYLLDKIKWLIPFHIQLAVQEMTMLSREAMTIVIETIDRAFDQMVDSRNHNHFEHYYSRLRTQFKGADFKFAEAILNIAAVEGMISKGTIYDQAVAFHVNDQVRQIVEILAYDGYINNNADIQTYQFNSPLVRLWWQKFICK